MFRAAFPTASDDAEKQESAWVKANFDLSGSNRSGKARFAGTWVSPTVALTIADSYSLREVLQPLTDAVPDPSAEYRKSSRAQQQVGGTQLTASEGIPKVSRQQLPTPAPSLNVEPGPTPAKRVRREASPAPAVLDTATTTRTTATSAATPRRSGRNASSFQTPLPKTTVASKSPVKASRTKAVEPTTPAGSDETVVEEDVPDVPGPDPEQDIAEQRALIANLKEQREEQRKQQTQENQDEAIAEEQGGMAKRGRDEVEAPLTFNFKEPEKEERVVATNRRVGRFIEMTPQRRSAAWGTAAFAAMFGLL